MNDENELSVNFSCNLSYNIKFTKEQVDGCIKLALEKFDEYLLSAVYELHRYDEMPQIKKYDLDNQSIIKDYKQKENLINEKFNNIFTLLYQVNDICDEYDVIANMIFHYAVEDYIKLNIETLMHDSDMCKELIVHVSDMDIIDK